VIIQLQVDCLEYNKANLLIKFRCRPIFELQLLTLHKIMTKNC
jgi:hypothetical protein